MNFKFQNHFFNWSNFSLFHLCCKIKFIVASNSREMTLESKYNLPSSLEFFNYHEYLVKNNVSSSGANHDASLVINHFPNIYVPSNSLSFAQTRIVRIPRDFTSRFSDLIPHFHETFPGTEQAAIVKQGQIEFEPVGTFNNQVFGSTSFTILTGVIEPQELQKLVYTINSMLHEAYSPFTLFGCLELVLNILTGTVYSMVFTTKSKQVLNLLEKKIQTMKGDGWRIILPRLNGYTSLDIEVDVQRLRSLSTSQTSVAPQTQFAHDASLRPNEGSQTNYELNEKQ